MCSDVTRLLHGKSTKSNLMPCCCENSSCLSYLIFSHKPLMQWLQRLPPWMSTNWNGWSSKVMLPHKPRRVPYTEKQKALKLFSLNALIPPCDDTLIASHHSMWFGTDFVPRHTWMKSCLQTMIISYISGELSSPSSQTSQLAAADIPTFQT